MDQERLNQLPWEQVEQFLKTKNWMDLSEEQKNLVGPYFSEQEYMEARHLLLQTSDLFKAERNLPQKPKSPWARLPYGLVAAAALTLLISLGYLILPEQQKSMAYSSTEEVKKAQPEEQRSKLSSPVQQESAPNLGSQSTLLKQKSETASSSPMEVLNLETEVYPMDGVEEEQDNRVERVRKSTHAAGHQHESPTPTASGAIPMVRDSIWKNDTLWLLIKTPHGDDSLLPAMNSKGKVWTRN